MDSPFKFVVVLSGKIEPGVALNAASHMSACLSAKASDEQRRAMSFVDYLDADQNAHPVSALSLIVLKAKNSNQIRTACQEAKLKGILAVDFLETMTGGDAQDQMARTRAKPEAELEYWGLGLFGLAADIDPITRRFSLWR